MIEGTNGKSAEDFNLAASNETRMQSRAALHSLLEEYKRQSDILAKVAMGKTSLHTAEQELVMADKMTAHLKNMALQIHIAALICARLDGVDVQEMIDDIQKLLPENAAAPGAQTRAP